jgi:hypothetical protein
MKRQIIGLKWAKPCGRPAAIPIGRPKGRKAAGLRFEKAIGQQLLGARRGQWFEFEDRNGHGWCQVDFLLPWAGRAVVIEAKYTWTEDGHRELEGLYLPVVEQAGFARPIGIVISRNLVPVRGRLAVRSTLGEAVEAAEDGRVVLHWLGVGPLLLRPPKGHPIGACGVASPI